MVTKLCCLTFVSARSRILAHRRSKAARKVNRGNYLARRARLRKTRDEHKVESVLDPLLSLFGRLHRGMFLKGPF